MKPFKTRMHSNRMRTIRCSGRLGGVCLPRGVSAQGVCLPWGSICPGGWGVCLEGGGCLPGRCLPERCVCSGGCLSGGVHLPLWGDFLTRLRKHYLSAISFADGNYQQEATAMHEVHGFSAITSKTGRWLSLQHTRPLGITQKSICWNEL